MASLEQQIQLQIDQGIIQPDPKQVEAVQLLQAITTNLQHNSGSPQKGLYLWGDVGRGKTWLMDQFFSALPLEKKQRLHYHQFMQTIHQALADLPAHADPLALVANQMAEQYRVICLDEFHVMDIADAVILHGLLRALFGHGVTLLTTSNRAPDDLYKNGSHRERFLPAIELLKQNTRVFHLDNDKDYRLNRSIQQDVFFTPHDAVVQQKLSAIFTQITQGQTTRQSPVTLYGREIAVIKSADDAIWFDFDTLCRGPRASSDYIQVAKQYNTVILSQIPQLFAGEEGPARRFLNLVDEFYDQHVFLLLSSEVSLDQMYQGELLTFEFKRVLSRLDEMQSCSYWESVKIAEKH